MANSIFDKTRIQAIQLYTDGINYLKKTYNQAAEMFTYASSYGQLMLVQQNLTNIVLYYMQDIATEQNILQARRTHNIMGASRLTGHNPSRGRSAIGEILLQKSNSNITLPGDVVYLTNHMRVKCVENGLIYLIELNADDMVVNMKTTKNVRLKIMEGTYDNAIFQGTGEDLQSYEVSMPAGKMIDDSKVIVSVNGSQADLYDSLYDMVFGNLGCMVKTGYSSGIDIFFGKEIATVIPPLGSTIRVDFLVTSGSLGNFNEKDKVTIQFVDTGFDMNGGEVDLNKIFAVSTTLVPQFGSDFEDPSLTKILAPYTSRNLIIHDDKSINYYFTKMNYFSSIKVYRDDINDLNNFKVILIPNILNRLNSSEDYFSCDISKYVLTTLEENRLVTAVEESGNKSTNITISLVDPNVRKYVVYIFADVLSIYQGKTVSELDIRRQMKTAINTYLLTPRQNHSRIPHSDIIKIMDGINQIVAMKAVFLSEQNEAAIIADPANASQNIGFDDMGNILTADNEIPLIRGGWTDRDGVTYQDQFDETSATMQSVNILLNFIAS